MAPKRRKQASDSPSANQQETPRAAPQDPVVQHQSAGMYAGGPYFSHFNAAEQDRALSGAMGIPSQLPMIPLFSGFPSAFPAGGSPPAGLGSGNLWNPSSSAVGAASSGFPLAADTSQLPNSSVSSLLLQSYLPLISTYQALYAQQYFAFLAMIQQQQQQQQSQQSQQHQHDQLVQQQQQQQALWNLQALQHPSDNFGNSVSSAVPANLSGFLPFVSPFSLAHSTAPSPSAGIAAPVVPAASLSSTSHSSANSAEPGRPASTAYANFAAPSKAAAGLDQPRQVVSEKILVDAGEREGEGHEQEQTDDVFADAMPEESPQKRTARGRWSREEKQRFAAAVRFFGYGQWEEIASYVGTRNAAQAEQQYNFNYGDIGPSIVGVVASPHNRKRKSMSDSSSRRSRGPQRYVEGDSPEARLAKPQNPTVEQSATAAGSPPHAAPEAHAPTAEPRLARKLGHWTDAEHKRFVEGLETFGTDGHWDDIARVVGTRDTMQVYKHYHIVKGTPGYGKRLGPGQSQGDLDHTRQLLASKEGPAAPQPDVNLSQRIKGWWTEKEHTKYLEGLEKFGAGKWRLISQLIGTRTVRQVQAHHSIVQMTNNYGAKLSAANRRNASRQEESVVSSVDDDEADTEEEPLPSETERQRKRARPAKPEGREQLGTPSAACGAEQAELTAGGAETSSSSQFHARWMTARQAANRGSASEVAISEDADEESAGDEGDGSEREENSIAGQVDEVAEAQAEIGQQSEGVRRNRKSIGPKGATRIASSQSGSAPRQEEVHAPGVGAPAGKMQNKVGAWTPREQELMQEAIARHGLDWRKVSSAIGSRTPRQVKNRYFYVQAALRTAPQTSPSPALGTAKGDSLHIRWKAEEHKRYVFAIERYGTHDNNWVQLARFIRSRNAQQVREYHMQQSSKLFVASKPASASRNRLTHSSLEAKDRAMKAGGSIEGTKGQAIWTGSEDGDEDERGDECFDEDEGKEPSRRVVGRASVLQERDGSIEDADGTEEDYIDAVVDAEAESGNIGAARHRALMRSSNHDDWKPDELARFSEALEKFSGGNAWREIAAHVGTRTARQVEDHYNVVCSENRFNQYLFTKRYHDNQKEDRTIRPASYNSGKWTEEEHEQYCAGIDRFGKDWKAVADCVRTRDVRQVIAHYKSVQLQQQAAATAVATRAAQSSAPSSSRLSTAELTSALEEFETVVCALLVEKKLQAMSDLTAFVEWYAQQYQLRDPQFKQIWQCTTKWLRELSNKYDLHQLRELD